MRLEHSERLSAQRALPLGGERTGEKRSGPRGSADGATGTPEGRVAVRLTLPLGVERTESARPRGEWQCAWYAQGRVEVQFTLPLGVERTGWNAQGRVAVRIGTPGPEWQCNRYVEGRVAVRTARRVRPRGEWQCVSHCHSVSNAPNRHARGASGSALGTLRAEWKCSSHCHSALNVRGGAFRPEWQCGRCAQRRAGNPRVAWQQYPRPLAILHSGQMTEQSGPQRI